MLQLERGSSGSSQAKPLKPGTEIRSSIESPSPENSHLLGGRERLWRPQKIRPLFMGKPQKSILRVSRKKTQGTPGGFGSCTVLGGGSPLRSPPPSLYPVDLGRIQPNRPRGPLPRWVKFGENWGIFRGGVEVQGKRPVGGGSNGSGGGGVLARGVDDQAYPTPGSSGSAIIPTPFPGSCLSIVSWLPPFWTRRVGL